MKLSLVRVKLYCIAVMVAVLVVAVSRPAAAHHPFSAEFDINLPVHLEGEVVKMEWINPHSWLHVDITTDAGEDERWRVQGAAPSTLLRRGWNRNSLPPGTRISVDGFQARDGGLRINARNVVFQDFRKLHIGSTGRGAPPVQE
jgi:hypothetical protein